MGLLIWLIATAIFIIPMWRIFSRAGFPGALSLLLLIPLVNLIVIYYVAFADWPERY